MESIGCKMGPQSLAKHSVCVQLHSKLKVRRSSIQRTPQLKKNASYDTHHSWEEFLCNLEWIGDEMEAQKFPVKSLRTNTSPIGTSI